MFHKYPYTDFHEANLDWFLDRFKELLVEFGNIEDAWKAFKDEFGDNLYNTVKNILDIWLDDGTIATYLNNLVIVNDYGAKGDGVTDDTEAIQRCIDQNPGASIYFKKGTYLISDTLELWGASGGQEIILGGCTLKWIGTESINSIMVNIEKDYEPAISSMCRICGGNLDGNSKCGVLIQNKAFYTDIGGVKCFDFTNIGILNGTLTYATNKSTQAKIHDCHIFQVNGNFSLDPTTALCLSYQDNQISNVVTNRTRIAYDLHSGGNNFVNCHSTIQWADNAEITSDLFDGIHIHLNPPNSGTTQANNFTNCYFNVGKYVVYAAKPTSLLTNLTNCQYIFYSSNLLPSASYEAFLNGGYSTYVSCTAFDIIAGAKLSFKDYFPVNNPTPNTVTPIMQFNRNRIHPEADLISANNLMTEGSFASNIINSSNVPTVNTIYEIGGILVTYTEATDEQQTQYHDPVKIEYSTNNTYNEAYLTYNGTSFELAYSMSATSLAQTRLFIDNAYEMKTINGRPYKLYKLYIQCTGDLGVRRSIKMYSKGFWNKCYMRYYIDSSNTINSIPENRLDLFTNGGIYTRNITIRPYEYATNSDNVGIGVLENSSLFGLRVEKVENAINIIPTNALAASEYTKNLGTSGGYRWDNLNIANTLTIGQTTINETQLIDLLNLLTP